MTDEVIGSHPEITTQGMDGGVSKYSPLSKKFVLSDFLQHSRRSFTPDPSEFLLDNGDNSNTNLSHVRLRKKYKRQMILSVVFLT